MPPVLNVSEIALGAFLAIPRSYNAAACVPAIGNFLHEKC